MLNSSLCYIERGDEWLLLHRVKKENDLNKDKWIGLGGKLEQNESPEDCLKREIYEESGLTLTSWRFRGIITFVNTVCETELMYLFTSDAFEGKLSDCDEGELEWIERSRLLHLTLWEGDKIFLRLLDSDEPFFSLKLVYDEADTLLAAALNGSPLPMDE